VPDGHSQGVDDDDAIDLAVTLNCARRHLTREQVRDVITNEIARRPGDSDRAIARRVGCSPSTVGAVRHPVSNLDSRPVTAEGARDSNDRAKVQLDEFRAAVAFAVGEATVTDRREQLELILQDVVALDDSETRGLLLKHAGEVVSVQTDQPTELEDYETRIDAAELFTAAREASGILTRWEFGRILVALRDADGRLPSGFLTGVAQATGKSRAELTLRMRLAERYDTADEVRVAIAQHSTWDAMIRDDLKPAWSA
jgi:hypothetical protein